MTAASFIRRDDHSSPQPARQRPFFQPGDDNSRDPAGCLSTPPRQSWPPRPYTLERILQELSDLGYDSLGRRTDETCVAASNALRPLSLLAQNEQRGA